jgi:DNA polymerase-3 subunit epsilon
MIRLHRKAREQQEIAEIPGLEQPEVHAAKALQYCADAGKGHGVTDSDRQRGVCKWAYDHIQARDFVIVDTETSGIDGQAEVLQIVIVNAWGRVAFSSLIKPGKPIDECGEAFAVNGISNAMVEWMPYMSDLRHLLAGLILSSGKPVIAYNAAFDQRMLAQSASSSFNLRPWDCAMLRYAEFAGEPGRYGDYKWHQLQRACAGMGLPMDRNWHDAAADALATYELIEALAGRYVGEEAAPE